MPEEPRLPRLLSCSKATFDHCFGLLVANFGTQNDAETLRAIKEVYRKVINVWEERGMGDDILNEATALLLAERDERGMPRIAELRAYIRRVQEKRTLYQSERNVSDTLRQLQYDYQDTRAGERRDVLAQCVEEVAQVLGRLQKLRSDEWRAKERQRQEDIERGYGKDNPLGQ